MRLRTFNAPDMPSAMKLVRESLGDNAIILSTEPQRGQKGISVTAAIDPNDELPAPPPAPVLSAKDKPAADQLRFDIQSCLRFHNLPELFIAKLMQKATDTELSAILSLHRVGGGKASNHLLQTALEKLASGYFRFDPLPMEGALRLMLVGPPGIGKTLTIAKLATRLAMDKKPLAVVTTDNKRAGGVEQLQAFTDILGITLTVADSRTKLTHFLKGLKPTMRVLVDTAGCNPYDNSEIKELQSCATPDIEPVLVLPAGGDSLEAIDIAEAFMALPIKKLLLTRADTARRFGGAMAAAAAHNLAFANVSRSSSVTDPLEVLDAALLARLLLRYQNLVANPLNMRNA